MTECFFSKIDWHEYVNNRCSIAGFIYLSSDSGSFLVFFVLLLIIQKSRNARRSPPRRIVSAIPCMYVLYLQSKTIFFFVADLFALGDDNRFPHWNVTLPLPARSQSLQGCPQAPGMTLTFKLAVTLTP